MKKKSLNSIIVSTAYSLVYVLSNSTIVGADAALPVQKTAPPPSAYDVHSLVEPALIAAAFTILGIVLLRVVRKKNKTSKQ